MYSLHYESKRNVKWSAKEKKKEDHASVDEGMLTGERLGILRLLDQVLGLSRDGSHFGTIERVKEFD